MGIRFYSKPKPNSPETFLAVTNYCSGLGSQVAFLDMGSGPSRHKQKKSMIINVSQVGIFNQPEFSSKVSQARTEGRTDPVVLQWDPWEGQLQEGIVRRKDSNARPPPEQVKS